MSINKATAGEDYIREDNIHLCVPAPTYDGVSPTSVAAAGDLVARSNAVANGVVLSKAGMKVWGYIESINTDALYLSVVELKDGARIVLPTASAVALGDAIESLGTRASTGITTRSQIQTQAGATGVGRVIMLNPTQVGTDGFGNSALVEFRAFPGGPANY